MALNNREKVNLKNLPKTLLDIIISSLTSIAGHKHPPEHTTFPHPVPVHLAAGRPTLRLRCGRC